MEGKGRGRGGTIGRNRNKLTALITARSNQTFPRSVPNRHRMATADSVFRRYTDGSEIIEPGPRPAFYIYSKTVNRRGTRGRVSRWNFQVYTVEQVRAVASIGENRSKTVRHGYRSLFFIVYFSFPSTSPLVSIYIYIYVFLSPLFHFT